MTRIPSGIIKASIKPGSVYYFRDEHLQTTQRHYLVVLNKNPLEDQVILLACASSKIQKVRRMRSNCPSESLVVITPEQYSGFSVVSIFDCNNIFTQSIENITRKYESNELRVKPEMDIGLVNILRQGVISSRLIAPRFKNMLLD